MANTEIPNNWRPRPHQLPLWNAIMKNQQRYAVSVWHRRAGKDSTAINITAAKAVSEPGLYYYMAPTQKHARKIIWDNVGADGLRIINQAFPKQIVKSSNDQEMRLVLESAGGKESIFQVLGSDNYDGIVGTNPRGLVFSEWAISEKPQAWTYLSPILRENKGWAIFPYTPRGLNHGYSLYNTALNNDEWFCELKTVEDTFKHDGSPIVSQADIQAEREGGMSEMAIAQEFYCRFHESTENQIIDADMLFQAQKRAEAIIKAKLQGSDSRLGGPKWPYDPGAACVLGIDVARFGDDRTVIATRIGRDFASIPPIVMQKKDLAQIAGVVHQHANKYKVDGIFIDATGLGAGLVDILRRQYRIPVLGIHFSEKAQNDRVYHSIRAEMYAKLNEWVVDPETVVTPSEALRSELTAIQFDHDAHDRIRLEPKKETKKRLLVSPDLADAHALTFARHVPRKDRGGGERQSQAVIGW